MIACLRVQQVDLHTYQLQDKQLLDQCHYNLSRAHQSLAQFPHAPDPTSLGFKVFTIGISITAVYLVSRYANERELGENFSSWLERSRGASTIAEELEYLDVFPSAQEAPDYYVDYDQTGPYSAEVGQGDAWDLKAFLSFIYRSRGPGYSASAFLR
jgi:hypothetical protein